jgi:hypothetical protein
MAVLDRSQLKLLSLWGPLVHLVVCKTLLVAALLTRANTMANREVNQELEMI